jgi:hypothetical protein
LISDDAETDPETGALCSIGPKLFRVSETLACGHSGIAAVANEFRQRMAPVADADNWERAEVLLRQAVSDTYALTGLFMRIAMAGTVGGVAGISEFPESEDDVVALPGTARINPYSALGSGGPVALIARAIASRLKPKPEGEDLLRLMTEAAVDVSRGCGRPIWRLDLPTGDDPYIWIE